MNPCQHPSSLPFSAPAPSPEHNHASYDLGEDLRFVLLSATVSVDKPLKYPAIFNSADVGVITKSDLAVAVEFDEAAAKRNIQAVRPGTEVFPVWAKTGEGMGACIEFVEGRRLRSRAAVGNSK